MTALTPSGSVTGAVDTGSQGVPAVRVLTLSKGSSALNGPEGTATWVVLALVFLFLNSCPCAGAAMRSRAAVRQNKVFFIIGVIWR